MATLAVLYKIGADISALQSGVTKGVQVMEGMEKTGAKLTTTLGTMAKAAAAAFTATQLADMGRQAIDTASKVQDAADKIGISAEAVQRLQFAAEQGGGSLENVGRAIAFMAKTLDDKGTPAKLKELGLNIETIKTMSPDRAFVAIADAIGKMDDPLRQATLAQELLGRSAMELMPAMKAGFTEIGKAAPFMSDAMVKSADDTGDAIALMHKRIDVLKAQAMLPLLNLFTSMPGPVQTFIGAIASLAPSLTGLASLVMMAGGPVAAFTAIASLFTVTLPAAFMAILPFLGPIGIIAVAIGAVVLAWKHWDKITAFVSGVYQAIKSFIVDKVIPILAVSGPLLGPVGMVITVWKNWDRITEIAKAVYTGVKSWMVDKFNAIVDSIKSKVDAVTGFFKNMYDKVVGNSYVPDMITGIGEEFSKLGAVMVDPTVAATGAVSTAFKDTQKSLSELARAMTDLAQTTGSSFIAGMASVVNAIDVGTKAITSLKGGFDDLTSGKGIGSILSGFTGIVSGIGGIVSAANVAINIGKALFNIFDRDKGRDLVENFAKEFSGGFNEIQGYMALLGDEGHRLWVKLTQGGDVHSNPEAARRAIEEVRSAIERLKASAASVQPVTFETRHIDTYERYGEPDMGFAGGTHGRFIDFGAGTPVTLHGRERVVTEAEGRAESAQGAQIAAALKRLPDMIGIALRDALIMAR
jgi:hypothetical protein